MANMAAHVRAIERRLEWDIRRQRLQAGATAMGCPWTWSLWFAWHPVRTDAGWRWLRRVERFSAPSIGTVYLDPIR